jgi:hypothetical protein
MAAYRVDVVVPHPSTVFGWVDEHIPKLFVIRQMAYKVEGGWYVKSVFASPEYAEMFHRHWHPEGNDHKVPPFGRRDGRDS